MIVVRRDRPYELLQAAEWVPPWRVPNTVQPPRRCDECGARQSRYRAPRERICAPCQKKKRSAA